MVEAQQAFDNRNSSCIHCGICIDVCPMDVLSFDQRPSASAVALPLLNPRPGTSAEHVR